MSIEVLTIKVTGGPKGQEKSKSIEVEQFLELRFAFGFLGLTDDNGKLTSYGNTYLLQAINFLYRRNTESRGRASLFPITISGIFEVAKKDPEVRHRLNLLLSELDLSQFQV